MINNKNIKDYIANQVLFEDIRVGERFFTTTQDGISQWIRISRGVYTKCVPSGDVSGATLPMPLHDSQTEQVGLSVLSLP